MRLILNKALDNINDNVNLKIIEITSTDFLNNDLDYFVYKYQIPLIKFTDTEEIFNVKNSKLNISPSLSETEIILDETDLELISGLGGAGGSQDLQSVLNNGTYVEFDGGFINSAAILGGSSFDRNVTFNVDNGASSGNGNEGGFFILENNIVELQGYNDNGRGDILIADGILELSQFNYTNNKKTTLLFNTPIATTFLKLPSPSVGGTYTLATLNDIKKIDLTGRVYENNAAAISGGLTTNDVYRTSTGELRIVV